MVKKIADAVISISVKLIVAVLVVVLLMNAGSWAYQFGIQIFAPLPVAQSPGRDVIVTVEEGESELEIAKHLEEKGLISNAYIFFIQAKLYKAEFYAGTYTLNTSMTSEEMLEFMIEEPTE